MGGCLVLMMQYFFQQLAQVRRFDFAAQSQTGSQMNWHQRARGRVECICSGHQIDFAEYFDFENGRHAQDRKRWCLDETQQTLSFWRWRNDDFERIFTFHWQPENRAWQPEQIYWCVPDEYRAELFYTAQAVELTIFIVSSKKNERLHYVYR